MNKEWFDMHDLRKKQFQKSIWIPLRASFKRINEGKFGYKGYRQEFFGCGSVLLPIEYKDNAKKLTWSDIGISHNHRSYVEDDIYYPADLFQNYNDGSKGIHPILDQERLDDQHSTWFVQQDIILALKLRKENESWICPEDGYTEVIREKYDEDGQCLQIEIKSNYLRDYLCARNMFLYITSFYERDYVTDDILNLKWNEGEDRYNSDFDRWECRVTPIHEGGHPFGESVAVFHVERNDLDEDDDIPDLSSIPTDSNTKGENWEKKFEGRKLYSLMAEYWHNELIFPMEKSVKVRGDDVESTNYFIIDAEGLKVNGDALIDSGKWLWFKPDVIVALSHQKAGKLMFYSRDTGGVSCFYGDHIHFGVNDIGLITVYAKDIGFLPDWQQKIWAGYNIAPEGGVSKELLASQVRATRASTQAPEEFIFEGINYVNYLSKEKLNIDIFRKHDSISDLVKKTHRFRSLDQQTFYSLAKDLARLTADSLDTESMQSICKPPKGTKWGSLKTLENLLSQKVENDMARKITSALVGIYELRHADAHLPTSSIEDSFSLLNIDRKLPFIFQGYQLLHDCVSSIYGIAEVLKRW